MELDEDSLACNCGVPVGRCELGGGSCANKGEEEEGGLHVADFVRGYNYLTSEVYRYLKNMTSSSVVLIEHPHPIWQG